MELLEVDMLTYPEDVRQSLRCVICLGLMQDAVSCPRGHSFCRTCILRWLADHENNMHCPVTRLPLTREQLTVSGLNHLIQNATVKCRNGGESISGVKYQCQWTGPVHFFPHHNASCTYKKVDCDYCRVEGIMRRDLPHHHNVCEKMEVQCDRCQDTMERGELNNHQKYWCREMEVSCPLLCGQLVPRKDHTTHVLGCANHKTSCPVPGCGKVVHNIYQHCREDGAHHTTLLLQAITRAEYRLLFTGALFPVSYIIEDITRPTKSPMFRTCHHDWRIVVLPPTLDNDTKLGVYLTLEAGNPAMVNVRVKLTYGTMKSIMYGNIYIKTGDVKGWAKAIAIEDMLQPVPTNTKIELVLQYFLC